MDSGSHINIHRLARAISTRLNLPNDDSLAFVIGSGDERTSTEAVTTWLRNELDNINRLSFTEVCTRLSIDLKKRLDESA